MVFFCSNWAITCAMIIFQILLFSRQQKNFYEKNTWMNNKYIKRLCVWTKKAIDFSYFGVLAFCFFERFGLLTPKVPKTLFPLVLLLSPFPMFQILGLLNPWTYCDRSCTPRHHNPSTDSPQETTRTYLRRPTLQQAIHHRAQSHSRRNNGRKNREICKP